MRLKQRTCSGRSETDADVASRSKSQSDWVRAASQTGCADIHYTRILNVLIPIMVHYMYETFDTV